MYDNLSCNGQSMSCMPPALITVGCTRKTENDYSISYTLECQCLIRVRYTQLFGSGTPLEEEGMRGGIPKHACMQTMDMQRPEEEDDRKQG